MLIKKLGSLLLALSMAAACIPATMVSAEGTQGTQEWIHIEAEDGFSRNDLKISKTGASAGKYLTSGHGNHAQSNSATVNIPATGKYDVFAVIGVPYNDQSNSNRGGYQFSFGTEEPFYKQYNNAVKAVNSTEFYRESLYSDAYGMSAYWVKVGSQIDLTAGETTLNFAVIYGQDGTKGIGMMDCIRIVPSSWSWTPGNNFDAPQDMTPTPDENGVVHMEAENGTVAGYQTTDEPMASGGKYLSIKKHNNGFTTYPSTTMSFKLNEGGKYDIYAAMATGSQDYLGGQKFTLDGSVIFEANMSTFDRSNVDLYGKDIDLHSGTPHMVKVRWVKIAEAKEIGKGTHTIVNELCKYSNANGIIDCVRLIPSGMSWEAKDFTTAPTVADYFDLEAEDGVVKSTYGGNLITTASTGDKYIFTNESNQAARPQGSTMTFYAKNGNYDIWALVGLDDYTAAARLCNYSFYLNDDAAPLASIGNNKNAVSVWSPLYETVQIASNIPTYAHWVKVGENVSLSGLNTITADVERTNGETGNRMGAIDKVRIVPSAWNHVPTTTTAAPVAPEVVYDSFTLSDKTAGANITATVTGIKKTVSEDKTAVVIIAVYKDGALVDVYPSTATALTNAGQNITANVTLPSDITGVTVKAFLWDGLAAGMPYATQIEK